MMTIDTHKAKSSATPSILIANGVNLDLLGRREEAIYGKQSLADLEKLLTEYGPFLAKKLGFAGCRLHFFQSNAEAEFLQKISASWDGALLNPGAWTHTSLALGDRLAALDLPFIEIHLSNLTRREAFRQHSYSAPYALGIIEGLGLDSYLAGLLALLSKLARQFP